MCTTGLKRKREGTGHITLDLHTSTEDMGQIDWTQYAARIEDSEFLQGLLTISEKSSIGSIHTKNHEIVPITREYEESFLCEPDEGERKCCMMSACEGLKLVDNGVGGFVLREFILPNCTQNTIPAMCLLCTRKSISRAYFSMLSADTSCRANCTLSSYYNLVNVPGEYRADDCIISNDDRYMGLLMPVVVYNRGDYRGQMENGKRCLVQFNLLVPTAEEGQEHIPFLTSSPAPRTNSPSGPSDCVDHSSI